MNGSKKNHKSEYVVSKEYPARPITNIPAKQSTDIIDEMLKEARELRAKKALPWGNIGHNKI